MVLQKEWRRVEGGINKPRQLMPQIFSHTNALLCRKAALATIVTVVPVRQCMCSASTCFFTLPTQSLCTPAHTSCLSPYRALQIRLTVNPTGSANKVAMSTCTPAYRFTMGRDTEQPNTTRVRAPPGWPNALHYMCTTHASPLLVMSD